MSVLRRLWLALLLAATAASALAQLPFVGTGSGAPVVSTYTGPGDAVAGAAAFWGLRAYTGAIVTAGTQKIVGLRRSSDSHSCDILVSASGGLGATTSCSTGADNGSTTASFCNATNCFATTLYDQTGNGNNLAQAAAASQPKLVLSCQATLPCLQSDASTNQLIYKGTSLAAISPEAVSGVINPSGSATTIPFSNLDGTIANFTGNYLAWNGSTNSKIVVSSAVNNSFATGSLTSAALAAGTAGVVGGVWTSSTSRTAYLNGTAATADTSSENPTTQNTLGLFAAVKSSSSNYFAGNLMELAVYGSALSGANMTALCHNQYSYWGTAVSC
jgi:hypothetical protein